MTTNEVVSVSADPLAPEVGNSASNILTGGLRKVVYKSNISSAYMRINFRRSNFYYTKIYIEFQAAPVKITITCSYGSSSAIVYHTSNNSSK